MLVSGTQHNDLLFVLFIVYKSGYAISSSEILVTIDCIPTWCTSYPWLIYFLTRSLYLLISLTCSFLPSSPCNLAPPTPATPRSLHLWFCFCSVRFVHLLCLLESTYSWSRTDFAFLVLTHFTYHNTLLVHWLLQWQDFILLLWLSNSPLCVCVCVYIYKTHHLYPFLYWRALGLFPYLGFCK